MSNGSIFDVTDQELIRNGFWCFAVRVAHDGEFKVYRRASLPWAPGIYVEGNDRDETLDRAHRLAALMNTYGMEFGGDSGSVLQRDRPVYCEVASQPDSGEADCAGGRGREEHC